MKSVLISIQPKWCAKIASGEKTVEVRKTKPKVETPFKVYIYCTYSKNGIAYCKGNEILNGKVIGEFVCEEITYFGNVATDPWKHLLGSTHEEHKRLITEKACLSESEMLQYKGHYGWHISDLKIYEKPKNLGDFKVRVTNKVWSFTKKLERPPQSWCYVED